MERCHHAFRPGTRHNQRSHALLYLAFTIYFSFRDIPAAAGTLLCFVEFLLRSYTAIKSVTNALSSVKRLHIDLRADVEAFDSPLLERWKRALPLTVRAAPSQAPPLPLALLERLCGLARSYGRQGEAFATLLAVGFHTMARLSSLVPQSARTFDHTRLPTLTDIRRSGNGFAINLKWSKTEQAGDRQVWVPLLHRTGSDACPVLALERLCELLRGAANGTPLFSFGEQLGGGRRTWSSFTMPLARAWLAALLWSLGRGQEGFSFHSLRRGACTLAFAGGCDVADIKLHGGWRSDAVNLYYSHSDARLRVATALANTN